jgi:hypothetical protein
MHSPVPLETIYQPTKIAVEPGFTLVRDKAGKTVERKLPSSPQSPEELLKIPSDFAIIAGPGWGKTTLLHYFYLHILRTKEALPVLFTLRRKPAVEDLLRFVDELRKLKKIEKANRLILLVDGYDEISSEHAETSLRVVDAFFGS